MSPVTHINQREAEAIRAELLAAVGTENVPNQWAIFMQTVRQRMPDVLGRGRPTQEAIQRSPIGQLGFSSWRAMVDAPTEEGGLGLGWSRWREWSRAWKAISDAPELVDAPITAAEVNRVVQQAKADDEPIPMTWAEWEAFKERHAEAKAERRAQSVAALEERVTELEKELAAATAAAHRYREEADREASDAAEANAALREAVRQNGASEADLRHRDHELAQLREAAQADQKRIQALEKHLQTAKGQVRNWQQLSRWELLKRAFRR